MMKITATAATPYSAVELTPEEDVEVIVVTEVETAVEAETLTLVVVVVLMTVVVLVLVLVLAVTDGRFCRVKATMSPEVVPGQVATASKLHVPIGMRMYSCPLTAAPIDTPWSIGAPT